MIISGGVNIYPAEVEGVLSAHPMVGDVAVIGIPDTEWGEQVKAVVELIDGVEPSDELAAELIALCQEQIARYKCPRSVDFRDHLPRTDGGQALQAPLARRVLGQRPSATSDARNGAEGSVTRWTSGSAKNKICCASRRAGSSTSTNRVADVRRSIEEPDVFDPGVAPRRRAGVDRHAGAAGVRGRQRHRAAAGRPRRPGRGAGPRAQPGSVRPVQRGGRRHRPLRHRAAGQGTPAPHRPG